MTSYFGLSYLQDAAKRASLVTRTHLTPKHYSQPQLESALLYAVKPAGLLLYLPKYGMRIAVHLTDRAGVVKPPLVSAEQVAGDGGSTHQTLVLETGRLRGSRLLSVARTN